MIEWKWDIVVVDSNEWYDCVVCKKDMMLMIHDTAWRTYCKELYWLWFCYITQDIPVCPDSMFDMSINESVWLGNPMLNSLFIFLYATWHMHCIKYSDKIVIHVSKTWPYWSAFPLSHYSSTPSGHSAKILEVSNPHTVNTFNHLPVKTESVLHVNWHKVMKVINK